MIDHPVTAQSDPTLRADRSAGEEVAKRLGISLPDGWHLELRPSWGPGMAPGVAEHQRIEQIATLLEKHR